MNIVCTFQIEDHRLSLARMEKEYGRHEELLKQEIAHLQKVTHIHIIQILVGDLFTRRKEFSAKKISATLIKEE